MNRLLMGVAALSALGSVTACDQRAQKTVPAAPVEGAVNPPVGDPLALEGVVFSYAGETTTEGFAQRMAMSDMYEVEASRLALERTQSANVRDFAQTMIDAHTATANELKAGLQSEKLIVDLPTALDLEHRERFNVLRRAEPADFDRTYLDQQTAAHQSALTALKRYAASGSNPAFKAWAGKTASAVSEHLDRAKTLDRAGADGTSTPGPTGTR